MLKIAGKTYTSIPALLFRSDQGRDILVEPTFPANSFCFVALRAGESFILPDENDKMLEKCIPTLQGQKMK